MSSHRRHRAWRALAVSVALSTAATACASSDAHHPAVRNEASAPGITPTTITIGSNQPLSGPAAPGYDEIAPGMNAMFQFINANGGIYGRKIKFVYRNDAYNPALTPGVIHQLVQQDHVFAIVGGLGTGPELSVAPFLTANRVPDLFVDTGCTCFNDPAKYPGFFGSIPDYTIEGKILATYVKQHYPGKRVAFIGQDDDLGSYGYQGVAKVLRVVADRSYNPLRLSAGLGAQIAAAKAARAQVIISFGITAATALEELAEAQLGYHPVNVVSEVGADSGTLAALVSAYSKGHANSSLDNGLVTDGYLPSPNDVTNPWVQLALAVHNHYDAREPADNLYFNAFEIGMLTYDALKAAGRNPTRQGVVAAIEKDGQRFPGPWLGPLGFSVSNHDASVALQISTLDNNKLALSGPVYTAGDSSPVSTYTGPSFSVPLSF